MELLQLLGGECRTEIAELFANYGEDLGAKVVRQFVIAGPAAPARCNARCAISGISVSEAGSLA
jgi:hypothetical protein